jgi:hypothetical protein
MRLDILISTANDGIYNIQELLLDPQKHIKYIISHQIYNEQEYNINFNREDVLYQQSKSKGLSKNRNITLSLASADICLFADDDVRFKKEWLANIINAFNSNPDSDILTFKINTPISNNRHKEYKEYPESPYQHNIRTIFQVSSIEIAFRLHKIKNNQLEFDENFGLSTDFNFGEENIFLKDALYCGLTLKFIPLYIISHPHAPSRKINTKKNIITSGAIFYRMFGNLALFMDIYSIFYNYRDYNSRFSPLKYFLWIIKGNKLGKKVTKIKPSLSKTIKLFLNVFKQGK